MKNSVLTVLVMIVATAFLYGCNTSNLSVDHDYKEDVNFSQYKTYRWHDDSAKAGGFKGNDIVKARIQEEVNKNLQAKGFTLVPTGEVDFTVNYSITTQAKTDVRSYNTYGGLTPGFTMGYGSGYYRYGYSVVYATAPEVRTVHYEEGTFVLDIVNSNNKLVWRGTAVGRLKNESTIEEKRASVHTVVSKVLEEFPPKSRTN
jgi:hypothetical protein